MHLQNVTDIVYDTINQLQCLCIEKYGVFPQIKVRWFESKQNVLPDDDEGDEFQSLKIRSDDIIDKSESVNTISTRSSSLTSLLPKPVSTSTSTSSKNSVFFECIGSHLHFALVELLKNSSRAVIEKYGVLDVDVAPPISIDISYTSSSSATRRTKHDQKGSIHSDGDRDSGDEGGVVASSIGIRVRDFGGGLSLQSRTNPYAYFASTAFIHNMTKTNQLPPAASSQSVSSTPSTSSSTITLQSSASSSASNNEPNYYYSRNFGAPFSGYGVGLAVTRQYVWSMGGDISIASLPFVGTDVVLFVKSNHQNQSI
jgi:hypothetical protein